MGYKQIAATVCARAEDSDKQQFHSKQQQQRQKQTKERAYSWLGWFAPQFRTGQFVERQHPIGQRLNGHHLL